MATLDILVYLVIPDLPDILDTQVLVVTLGIVVYPDIQGSVDILASLGIADSLAIGGIPVYLDTLVRELAGTLDREAAL